MQGIVFVISIILNALGMIIIYLSMIRNIKGLVEVFKKVLPGALLGAGAAMLLQRPITIMCFFESVSFGMLLAEVLIILYNTARSAWQNQKPSYYYDDGRPPKFYITGDKHRNFDSVKNFCKENCTRRKDVLIILGDTGFNYFDDFRDDNLKKQISDLNITLFCLHGNKENRPQNISTYGIRSFCGGMVYYEPRYPNIYFAIDGEIYTLDGKKYMVVGGAHSVDKMKCLEKGMPYWEDEEPNEEIRQKVEETLKENSNKIYGMLTHTCPIEYLPTEMFLSTQSNAAIKRKPRKTKSKKLFAPDIDRSIEEWLGKIEKELDYEVWFCGHYHIDKQLNKVYMLYNEIRPLNLYGE